MSSADSATRNTVDIAAVLVLRALTRLPVIVDPSRASLRELVIPLAVSTAAIGADGLIIEAHPNPAEALCDKDQALTGNDLSKLVTALKLILAAQGRRLWVSQLSGDHFEDRTGSHNPEGLNLT